MPRSGDFGIVGFVIDAPVRGELRVRDQALVVVDDTGKITVVLDRDADGYHAVRDQLTERGRLTELDDGQFLLPGFIDLHNHAPQWPQLGKALDVPLEVWLNRYTFPLEARYADVGFAAEVYESLVSAMLANGTTTAVYFATTHLVATQRLVDICLDRGQRALVGKVAMDHPDGCPDFYRDDSAVIGVEETAQLAEYISQHPANAEALVLPAVTPRFIPSCTDELLGGLGELVEKTGLHVQTHCSESDWAHSYGMERFGQSDVATYHDFGLLTSKTVLAHCNFVSTEDLELMANTGAAVAHCPLSNVFFANAVFPLRETLAAGVHVGLGTDISGGPSPSMFGAVGGAVMVSRVREDGVDATLPSSERGTDGSRISFADSFWMATTGGGVALGLPIGELSPGYSFDAVVVDSTVADTDLMVWPQLDSPADILQKILNNTVQRNVTRVWVQGRLVAATVS